MACRAVAAQSDNRVSPGRKKARNPAVNDHRPGKALMHEDKIITMHKICTAAEKLAARIMTGGFSLIERMTWLKKEAWAPAVS